MNDNPESRFVDRIFSGGQTGADRAALDWAIAQGIPHGGWCAQGRLAEDGAIAARYKLDELEGGGYRQRTKRNVLDSDGTLILNLGELDGGTLETQRFADRLNKPSRLVQLDAGVNMQDIETVRAWLRANAIRVLNVAGPRESKRPRIYQLTLQFLNALMEANRVER